MAQKELDLDGRIFAALVGSGLGLAVAQMAAPQHSLKIAAAGGVLGTIALPNLFPTAYYGKEAEPAPAG